MRISDWSSDVCSSDLRPKGVWSKINIGHAERLVAAGRMQPAGLREIEAAKADGRWDAAYEGAARMDVPGELAAALAGNRKAKAFFDTLDRTNRYAFCWRVQTAKKPETRDARADKFVAMLARGEERQGSRKRTRLKSSHQGPDRMPAPACNKK